MKKVEKELVERLNLTVTSSDLALLEAIKKRCLLLGIDTTMSQLARAGFALVDQLSNDKIKKILEETPQLKAGRKKLLSKS